MSEEKLRTFMYKRVLKKGKISSEYPNILKICKCQ